jgi:adenosylhomocysteine nucleosidase
MRRKRDRWNRKRALPPGILLIVAIALIAALPSEIRPLTRGWTPDGDLMTGRIGSTATIAIAGGLGAAAATRACEDILAYSRIDGPVDTLVSIGYAGSLSCGLKPPDACAVREVIDAASGERFAAGTEKGQRLITLDRAAGPDEKRRLATQYQAVLVDMEAAAVARFARDHNLGFLCFKAVTDGPNDKLPDFNRFIGADGAWCMTPFLFYALMHPASWSCLWRLGSNSRAASRELANLVHRSVAGTQ